MNPIASFLCHLCGGFLALAAAALALLFALSFSAWVLMPPELRQGDRRPRPLALLVLFTLTTTASYHLLK